MNIIFKYFIVFVITLVFKWTFATCLHFSFIQIHESKSEESAQQLYMFLKYFSRILGLIFFIIVFIWDFIAFGTLTGLQQLIMSMFFFFLFGYYRSSIGLLNHFINLVYFPQLIENVEWEGVFGEIKNVDGDLYLIHNSSKTKLDITHLVS